jgi:hypothetical protein
MDSHFHRRFNGIVELNHNFKENAEKFFLDWAGKKIKPIESSSTVEQGHHEGQVNKGTTFGGTDFKHKIVAPQCTIKQFLCDTPQKAGASDNDDVPDLIDHEGRVVL